MHKSLLESKLKSPNWTERIDCGTVNDWAGGKHNSYERHVKWKKVSMETMVATATSNVFSNTRAPQYGCIQYIHAYLFVSYDLSSTIRTHIRWKTCESHTRTAIYRRCCQSPPLSVAAHSRQTDDMLERMLCVCLAAVYRPTKQPPNIGQIMVNNHTVTENLNVEKCLVVKASH